MPSATLEHALNRLRNGQRRINRVIQEYDQKATALESKIVVAASRAAERVAPLIIQFLKQNYQYSGINVGSSKDGTTHIMSMLDGTIVRLVWKGKAHAPTGVTLMYGMPAGLPVKDYKKASSLNYGAVRTSRANRGVLADKAKRSFKKAAWRQTKLTNRREAWLAKVGITFTPSNTTVRAKSITVGGIVATKAWKWYGLRAAQMQKVVETFTAALADEMTNVQ